MLKRTKTSSKQLVAKSAHSSQVFKVSAQLPFYISMPHQQEQQQEFGLTGRKRVEAWLYLLQTWNSHISALWEESDNKKQATNVQETEQMQTNFYNTMKKYM